MKETSVNLDSLSDEEFYATLKKIGIFEIVEAKHAQRFKNIFNRTKLKEIIREEINWEVRESLTSFFSHATLTKNTYPGLFTKLVQKDLKEVLDEYVILGYKVEVDESSITISY